MDSDTETKTRPLSRWWPILLMVTVSVAAGVFANLALSPDQQVQASDEIAQLETIQAKLINSTVLPENFKTVPAFSLLTADNQAITQQVFEDKWTVAFFGFTHCPDICPATLAAMNSVLSSLEPSVAEPQVIFVTVDPVRDTVEKLSEYVAYFNEDFIGITGDLTDITKLTQALGIVASYTASEDDPNQYTVDHTASMLLIDPSLRVRARINAPHSVKNITNDYSELYKALNPPS